MGFVGKRAGRCWKEEEGREAAAGIPESFNLSTPKSLEVATTIVTTYAHGV